MKSLDLVPDMVDEGKATEMCYLEFLNALYSAAQPLAMLSMGAPCISWGGTFG